MASAKKFSSKMDETLLKSLRQLATESGVEISALLEEAVRDFLNKNQMRPAVLSAAERALDQFEKAFKELAK
ncbi:MAG: ribbon-helix-helix domain-containing protein [Pseudomonadota bacterium]